MMEIEKTTTAQAHIGLCADCRYMRLLRSDRNSTFYFCERSKTDASFPKYPRLPVMDCSGYQSKPLDVSHSPDPQ